MLTYKNIIIQTIKEKGVIDLYTYMKLCQTHAASGYYRHKPASSIVGADGDFITASHISPLFGEMIAFWVVVQWERLGKPSQLNIIELGGGQGELMEQVLRTLQKLASFQAEITVHFVEINPEFRALQAEKAAPFAAVFQHESLSFLSTLMMPVLMIANEFFDAMPVRQWVYKEAQWHEVGVGLGDKSLLQWVYTPCDAKPDNLEYAPDTEEIMQQLGGHLHQHGGAALVIDYGYWDGNGDSVQAVYQHQYVRILDYPGEADLSAHVHFKKMAEGLETYRLQYAYQTQRQFLLDHGILLRLEQVCCQLSSCKAKLLRQGVDRLISSAQMGELFKVLQIWKI